MWIKNYPHIHYMRIKPTLKYCIFFQELLNMALSDKLPTTNH